MQVIKKMDLTTGPILPSIIKVAIPTLMLSLIQMTYNLADLFWVGRVDQIGLDPIEAIAAVGTVGFFPWFGFGMIMIVRIGTSVRVAQAAGRNDQARIQTLVNNGLVAMFLLSLIYMSYGFFFASHYVSLFRLENANVIAYAENYLRILSGFGFAFFLVNFFNGVYEGLGKTLNSFYINGIGFLINLILDPIFILTFGLGVAGAAMATVIAQSTMLIIYVVIYFSPRQPAKLRLIAERSFSTVKDILRVGFPAGLQSMVMTSIAIVVGVLVARYGERAISISRIGSQIEALSWMIASGFQVALAAFVGQNYGAYQTPRINEGYKASLKILVPYGLAINVILFVFARPLFGLFVQDPQTLEGGATYLRILSISQLFMMLELMSAGAFNGVGKTHVPSIVGMSFNLLRIPWALLALNVTGIWWGISMTSVFKGSVLLILFLITLKRLMADHETRLSVAKTEWLKYNN